MINLGKLTDFADGLRSYTVSMGATGNMCITGDDRQHAMNVMAKKLSDDMKKQGMPYKIVVLDLDDSFSEDMGTVFYAGAGKKPGSTLRYNPCQIPAGVDMQVWLSGLINIFCHSYGLLSKDRANLTKIIHQAYQYITASEGNYIASSANITFRSLSDSAFRLAEHNPDHDVIQRLAERIKTIADNPSVNIQEFIPNMFTAPGTYVIKFPEPALSANGFIAGTLLYRYFLQTAKYQNDIPTHFFITGGAESALVKKGPSVEPIFRPMYNYCTAYKIHIIASTAFISQISEHFLANTHLVLAEENE